MSYRAADSILFLVPPLNMAFTSSQAWTTSSGGVPLSFICRRQELKLAASGCTYLSPGPTRCEWKINLFGEKKRPQYAHLMHFARDELYLGKYICVRRKTHHSPSWYKYSILNILYLQTTMVYEVLHNKEKTSSTSSGTESSKEESKLFSITLNVWKFNSQIRQY